MSEETWSTDEMPLVAYLAMNDVSPTSEGWEQVRGAKDSYFWHFVDCTELADLVADYYGGKGRVDPRQFFEVQGRLKRDIFGPRGRNRVSAG